jgi:hypothetical protein
MGKGLLPWWRRRIAARGLAGAALFAVPVAVAAAIGFGTSISGLAGGLSAVTSGPGAVPASAQTSPSKLNLALVAQANRQIGSNGSASSRGGGGVRGGGGGSTGTTGAGSGSEGSGSGSGSGSSPVIDTSTSPPQINLPHTGGATDGVTNGVNNTVNNLLGGVNNTVNGPLGGK